MGTDLFIYPEVQISSDWSFAGRLAENPHFGSEPGEPKDEPQSIYEFRNYFLFAILADVRNYRAHPSLVPIAKPRGFPEDGSPTLRKWFEVWVATRNHQAGFCFASCLSSIGLATRT
ncbi:MAG: hypothetical protein AAFU77_12525 [Myxococcota bacterium]